MITVHIWKYRGSLKAWGHASLHVGQTYISWWPGESVAMLEALTLRNRPYTEDVFDERLPPDNPTGLPDEDIPIDGLDEDAIRVWWASFGLVNDGRELAGPVPSWHALKRNCSTVIALALKVGGGDRYASWYRSWNFVWDPEDVRAYAHEIRDGLARVRRRPGRNRSRH